MRTTVLFFSAIVLFFSSIIPFISANASDIDATDKKFVEDLGKAIIIQNPTGEAAFYFKGRKIAEAKSLSTSPGVETGVLIKGDPIFFNNANTDPTPTLTPKGPCGDLPCPEPTPKPTPTPCSGPACPGGVPFMTTDRELLIYINENAGVFSDKLDITDLP